VSGDSGTGRLTSGVPLSLVTITVTIVMSRLSATAVTVTAVITVPLSPLLHVTDCHHCPLVSEFRSQGGVSAFDKKR
jgi:hypothetical protein